MSAQQLDVWAPRARAVELVLRPVEGGTEHVVPCIPDSGGWWRPAERPAADDYDYGYRLTRQDGSTTRVLPDPRSRRQPDGVHGLSRTVDPSEFAWTDHDWRGRALPGHVIYEMHIGTFTPEGTLDAAIDRLDHLVSIGVDFVELLPVNAFNGTHNWGYDGVLWYAVQESYGGPAAYQRFVDAAHRRGLAVIQDVVYNHLGPTGNYLPEFGPYLVSGESNTWGELLNLDQDGSAEVREFIIENALMWLRDYHVDGLRLDAVHALRDQSRTHLLKELGTRVEALSAFVRRPLTLIAESDLNDPVMFLPREGEGHGLTAQWSDDFHHALHVALTRETTGYYADFEPLSALAKVLREGFFHNGTWSSFRERDHGKPIDTENTSTWRLVVCSQNHDQIGNRAVGDRITQSLDDGQLAIAATLTLLGPFTPMLFMGEEWAATTPWQFFTSHPEPELGEATAKGRIAEFARMGWDPDVVPDPQDPETFTRSKLRWSEPYPPADEVDSFTALDVLASLGNATQHHDLAVPPPAQGHQHTRILALYRELAALRRQYPSFTHPSFTHNEVRFEDGQNRWLDLRRKDVGILANFAETPVDVREIIGPVVPLLRSEEIVDAPIDRTSDPLLRPAHSVLVYRIDPV